MQYQAKPHLAAATQKWLGRHMKGWLKRWPSKGGGLNLSDYGLWSQVRGKPATMLELRTSILRHLTAFPDEQIHKCVAAFPKRVRLCIEAKGGYFEKK